MRNLDDGRVEVVWEGEEDRAKALERWLGRGPRHAEVSAVEVEYMPLQGIAGTYSGQPAIDALRAGGISIPAGLTQVSTHYMTNGADTRTHGLDLTASYLTRLGEWGRIDWRLGANVNRTKLVRKVGKINLSPLWSFALFEQQ